jgi:hypothetical protein
VVVGIGLQLILHSGEPGGYILVLEDRNGLCLLRLTTKWPYPSWSVMSGHGSDSGSGRVSD